MKQRRPLWELDQALAQLQRWTCVLITLSESTCFQPERTRFCSLRWTCRQDVRKVAVLVPVLPNPDEPQRRAALVITADGGLGPRDYPNVPQSDHTKS